LARIEILVELFKDDLPGPHVFDKSVGYDLAGIQSAKVSGIIESTHDASAEIKRLRPEIGGAFESMREHDLSPVVSGTVKLSTFHGYSPDEFEAITQHLTDHQFPSSWPC